MVEIKNPFGSVQTNPQANAWWVPLFIFLKKCFSETPYCTRLEEKLLITCCVFANFQSGSGYECWKEKSHQKS